MAGLKLKLPASTIIETVVASVLFLLIFFICIESITRINSMSRGEEPLEVEMDFNNCIKMFTAEKYGEGEYTMTYRWGDITVSVKPYPEHEDISELNFTAGFNNGRSSDIRYRVLIPADNETE